MTLDESYLGDSGYFTDYVGTVEDAYFGPSEKGDADLLYLFLEMKTDSPDRPEHTERYSLGKGWVTDDGGETVRHEEGKKKFNRRFSTYQSGWLDNAVKLLVDAGLAEEFASRGPATQADVWKGTSWQIGEHSETYQRWNREAKKPMVDDDGKPVMATSRTNVPVALISLNSGSEGGSAVGVPTNGSRASVDLSWADEETLGKLREVARSTRSRDAFLDRALLDVPELGKIEGGIGKVAGSGVYEALRG